MGVNGLWKLLDGTGRPLDYESLRGKVLAVDISVWLNKAIKGMRDYQGHSMSNAHLVTLFNRICKLLHFGIKPVFVFDGQAPLIKRKTIQERKQRRDYNLKESNRANKKILQLHLQKQILQTALQTPSSEPVAEVQESEKTIAKLDKEPKNPQVERDIFELPAVNPQLRNESDDEDFEEDLNIRADMLARFTDGPNNELFNIASLDIDSSDFRSLPSDIQYELLKDLKEIKKRRRTRMEVMPEQSDSFSSYQIAGLLAKSKINRRMEMVEKKITEESASTSLLDKFIGKDDVPHKIDARQLISDSSSHYILIRKQSKVTEKKVIEPECKPELIQHSADNSERINLNEACENSILRKTHNTAMAEVATVQSVLDNEESKMESIILSDVLNEGVTNTLAESVNKKNNHNNSDETRKPAIIVEPNTNGEELDVIQLNIGDTMKSNEKKMKKAVVSNNSPCIANSHVDSDILERDHIAIGSEHQSIYVPNNSTGNVLTETAIMKTDSDSSGSDNFIEVSAEAGNVPSNESRIEADIATVVSSSTNNANIVLSSDELCDDSNIDNINNVEPTNLWEGLEINDVERFTTQLDAESRELKKMAQAKERASRDLSSSARTECQELLKLFGIPYLISPQEAEAQCATLELLGLTNGTITEDSDIWLFGGQLVIRNMFDSKSDPVAFNVCDIEMSLGINRDRFICIALCSGSDYTCGIEGVGSVTALEIIKEFQVEGISGLWEFKEWWLKNNAEKKSLITETETKIKSHIRRLNLKSDFPSATVYEAYLKPVVDCTRTEFEWGFPDLDELRRFAVNNIGWSMRKVNETLLALIKNMGQQRTEQSKITNYLYARNPLVSSKKASKRVQRAAAALTGKVTKVVSTKAGAKKRKVEKTNSLLINKKGKLELSESSSSDEEPSYIPK